MKDARRSVLRGAAKGVGAGRRIDLLIVDDDEEIRNLLARRFGRCGFEVQEAANAARALTEVSDDALANNERSHKIEVFRRARGNKLRAARALGIHRRTLYRLLEKHGIQTTEDTENGSTN